MEKEVERMYEKSFSKCKNEQQHKQDGGARVSGAPIIFVRINKMGNF